jgi:hypothetical protein
MPKNPDTETSATVTNVLEWVERKQYPGGFTAESELGPYSVASYDGMWTAFRNGNETIEVELPLDQAKQVAQTDFENRLSLAKTATSKNTIAEYYYSQGQIDELASQGKLVPSNFVQPSYLAKSLTVIVLYTTGRWVTGRVDEHQWDRITHYHVPDTSSSVGANPEAVRQLNAMVDAWEALPGGRQVKNKDVEAWLAASMTPAINSIRQFLNRRPPIV